MNDNKIRKLENTRDKINQIIESTKEFLDSFMELKMGFNPILFLGVWMGLYVILLWSWALIGIDVNNSEAVDYALFEILPMLIIVRRPLVWVIVNVMLLVPKAIVKIIEEIITKESEKQVA